MRASVNVAAVDFVVIVIELAFLAVAAFFGDSFRRVVALAARKECASLTTRGILGLLEHLYIPILIT